MLRRWPLFTIRRHGVTEGRRRGSAGPAGLDAVSRDQCGCCTFVLHVASSSRSQVRRLSCWAHPDELTWWGLSANVRRNPCWKAAIVTQLAHPACSRAWRGVSSARSAHSAACRLCFEPLPAPIARQSSSRCRPKASSRLCNEITRKRCGMDCRGCAGG